MTTFTITGVIEGSDGSKTEFMMLTDHGSWNQWGDASTEQLGERVEFLDAIAAGLAENSCYFEQSEEDEA